MMSFNFVSMGLPQIVKLAYLHRTSWIMKKASRSDHVFTLSYRVQGSGIINTVLDTIPFFFAGSNSQFIKSVVFVASFAGMVALEYAKNTESVSDLAQWVETSITAIDKTVALANNVFTIMQDCAATKPSDCNTEDKLTDQYRRQIDREDA